MTRGTVAVDGVRLAFEVSGEGDPLLLVNGTGMPANAWELFGVGTLREGGFRVITFDNRGVGESDGPPGPYSVEMMAADAAGLIAALDVGPVDVLGPSLGGAIAQWLAAEHAHLVEAAVLWASCGRSPSFFRRLLAVERELAAAGEVPASWHQWQYLLISLPFDTLQRDDATVDAVAEILQEGVAWSGDGRAGQFSADVEWDTADHSDLYVRIQCPSLVIAHEHDIIYPPHTGREAAAMMAHGRFIEIPGLAHGQAVEAAPRVMREAVDFFHSAA